MSLFSNFRERLKVKTQTEKRYTLSDIKLRLDRETGRIGIYLTEIPLIKEESGRRLVSSKYLRRDVNIEDPKNVIEYTRGIYRSKNRI